MSYDKIKKPEHYHHAGSDLEVIKIIEAYKLGFNLGNAVKYILRSPVKGASLEDLQKARQYLTREINTRLGNPSWESTDAE